MRINIFGGPGIGKSTTAARIFVALKQRGHNIELVTEYVKSWAWEKRVPNGYDQLYIFAKQLRAEDMLLRQGTHVVTDSPLPSQLVYAKMFIPHIYDELFSLSKKFDQQHPAVNILLERTVTYQPVGRYETPDEARKLDERLLVLLKEYNCPFVLIDPQKDNELLIKITEGSLNEVCRNAVTE